MSDAKRQKTIAPWLARLYDESLTELDMKWTNIGPKGGIELAEAVAANGSLRTLNVERCGLAYQGDI